jgi:hypothetical protein
MLIYFAVTFMGPTPPPHPAVYLPFNLPWLVAPAVLLLRMLRAEPFGAPGQGRAPAGVMAPG